MIPNKSPYTKDLDPFLTVLMFYPTIYLNLNKIMCLFFSPDSTYYNTTGHTQWYYFLAFNTRKNV